MGVGAKMKIQPVFARGERGTTTLGAHAEFGERQMPPRGPWVAAERRGFRCRRLGATLTS